MSNAAAEIQTQLFSPQANQTPIKINDTKEIDDCFDRWFGDGKNICYYHIDGLCSDYHCLLFK